jgi:nicotinamide riboside transporter PnuC
MMNTKGYKMLAWLGTICGIIGSVLVAANNGFQFVGYISFLVGAISCLITSIQRKDNSGITLWGFFTAVNIMGIYNYV